MHAGLRRSGGVSVWSRWSALIRRRRGNLAATERVPLMTQVRLSRPGARPCARHLVGVLAVAVLAGCAAPDPLTPTIAATYTARPMMNRPRAAIAARDPPGGICPGGGCGPGRRLASAPHDSGSGCSGGLLVGGTICAPSPRCRRSFERNRGVSSARGVPDTSRVTRGLRACGPMGGGGQGLLPLRRSGGLLAV